MPQTVLLQTVIMAIFYGSAVGGGPSMFIQHSKDPNILFLGSMLVGRCSSCASSNTDLVWAYILNGRTVALEDMLITEQNITQELLAPHDLCGAGTKDNFSLTLEMEVTETVDKVQFACLSRKDLGRSCDDGSVFCQSSVEFNVEHGPSGPVTVKVMSTTSLDQLTVNSTVTVSCTACVEHDGHISWALRRNGVNEKVSKKAPFLLKMKETRNYSSNVCGGPWANSTIYLRMTQYLSGFRLVCFPFDFQNSRYVFPERDDLFNGTDVFTLSLRSLPKVVVDEFGGIIIIFWYLLGLMLLTMLAVLLLTSCSPGQTEQVSETEFERLKHLEIFWDMEPNETRFSTQSEYAWHGIIRPSHAHVTSLIHPEDLDRIKQGTVTSV
ncbi:hypothetical protein RRG08_039233 [Elysia crispata]|uniref:Uncharacterized protein n=1 Tax=Elysia crispata TaxID=231223 RepID=A0AAE1BGF9_9GAST|nr:hypothetical protein RRG08_039233 [Elysia crispata]